MNTEISYACKMPEKEKYQKKRKPRAKVDKDAAVRQRGILNASRQQSLAIARQDIQRRQHMAQLKAAQLTLYGTEGWN